MPTRRHSFALEEADAELDAWLRSLANRSAVIRASLVEERERPRRLARIEERVITQLPEIMAKLDVLDAKVNQLLTGQVPVPRLALSAITDEDREVLMDLLRKYGTEE